MECFQPSLRNWRIEFEIVRHRMGNLSWNTFYLAFVDDKDQVLRMNAKPIFRVVGTVARHCLSIFDLGHLN